MGKKKIIEKTERYVSAEFKTEGSGHDWFHIDRVRKMAVKLANAEHCDLFIVEMAALLHDLDDWKLTGSGSEALRKTSEWLGQLPIDEASTRQIIRVIQEVSFKGAGTSTPVTSTEAAVVQDADRLDAIGAIGIARTFAYGGYKNRLIYDPEVNPEVHTDFQAYQNSTAPTINHFYEKLLLLKDRMNTHSARKIAEERHQFMADYLSRFFDEWEAKK